LNISPLVRTTLLIASIVWTGIRMVRTTWRNPERVAAPVLELVDRLHQSEHSPRGAFLAKLTVRRLKRGCLPIRRRSQGHHQSLHRRHKRRSKALGLDRRSSPSSPLSNAGNKR
jgi:hypothetical protein